MTPEWEAAIRTGDALSVLRLIREGADVDSRDQHGQTGLMVASMRGHSDVVQSLLAHDPDLDHTAKYHLSAVMLAVLNGHVDITRMLVEAGADLTTRGTGAPGFYEKTAADLARAQKREDLVTLLESSDASKAG